MKLPMLAMMSILMGCGQMTGEQDVASVRPAASLATSAPNASVPAITKITVADLKRQGFDDLGGLEGDWGCGPGCQADGFVHVEFGRAMKNGRNAQVLYRCPRTDADVDQWDCDKVGHANG